MEAVQRKAESGRIWKNYEETRENEGKRSRKKTSGRSFNPIHFDKHHE
jgi:hypothetical protein